MATYESAGATALRLITAKGGPLVLSRRTGRSFDPITETETATTATHTLRAVGMPPGRSAEYRTGSLVGRRVIEFHIAQWQAPVTPEPGDAVRWGGQDWTIFWAATYDPAADGAVYTLAYAER